MLKKKSGSGRRAVFRHPQVDNVQLFSPQAAQSEEVTDLLLHLKKPGPEAPRWFLSPGWRWVLKHLVLGDVSLWLLQEAPACRGKLIPL